MEITHKRKRGGGMFFRTAIAAAFATSAPFGIALAQEGQEAANDTIQVTGSRIKRGNIEGPLPVTVYSREDIDISGDLTVTDFLRALPQNSFGSFIPESISGRGGQTNATVSLRGLGSGRTLILVDGRRMPGSSQSAGSAQNLNSIPMAAVERIEVLREGASAIYGADAIGGVINVITRKDYEGVEFSGQLERPSRDGGDGAAASMSIGISSSKGSLFLSAEHFQRAQILAKDRDYLFNQPPSSLGFPASFQRRTTDSGDPDNPDVPTNTNYQAAANCPTGGFDSDPNFPNSNRQPVPGVAGEPCAFRFASFGGESPKLARDSFSVFGTYNITENITSFTRASASRIEGFNQLAPAPAVFTNAISASDPNNPTRGEREGTEDGYDLNVRFRFVPLGNRESFDVDHVFGFVTGLNGRFDFLGDSEWEVAVSHNRSRSDGELRNVILISELFAAIDEGAFNFFDPSADVLDRVRATGYGSTKFRSRGVDGRVALGGIPLGFAELPIVVGAEYREDAYSNLSDPQSSAGNIAGSSGGAGADAKRNYTGLYIEALLPLLDNRLELGAALRRDDYSDIGNEISPKFSISYRPIDSVLLRASYSEGFAVPDMDTLFTSPAQSFEGAIDSLRCAAAGDVNSPFCQSAQFETRIGGNPDLEAETSENFSAGVIWHILPNLSVGVDYFNIKLDNGIKFLEIQDLLDNERACAAGNPCDSSLVSAIQRAPNGDIDLILTSSFNFAKIETDGFDLDITYSQDTGVGQFGFQLLATYVNSFKEQISPTGDLFERVDTLVADVGSGAVYADYRLNTNVTWKWQDFNAAVGLNYLPSVKDCTAQQRDDEDLRELCNKSFGSFSTIDAQVGYSAPWGTELIVGVRNLADKDPPISQQSESYIKEASDLIGRTPYVRIKQTF